VNGEAERALLEAGVALRVLGCELRFEMTDEQHPQRAELKRDGNGENTGKNTREQ